MSQTYKFRSYTRVEFLTDAVVHVLGTPLGIAAAIWLVQRSIAFDGFNIFVNTIYALGLVGMLAASAAYQLTPPSLAKERLRRADRAMIFIMIAGTYTPIATTVLARHSGITLCTILWIIAAGGVFLTLRYPRRFERVIFTVYLAMGWMMVLILRDCYVLLSTLVFTLLVAGGLIYTLGAAIRATRMKFHNPIWHSLILLAAGLQYAAISLQLGK